MARRQACDILSSAATQPKIEMQSVLEQEGVSLSEVHLVLVTVDS